MARAGVSEANADDAAALHAKLKLRGQETPKHWGLAQLQFAVATTAHSDRVDTRHFLQRLHRQNVHTLREWIARAHRRDDVGAVQPQILLACQKPRAGFGAAENLISKPTRREPAVNTTSISAPDAVR